MLVGVCSEELPYKLILLDQVVARLYDNVVLVPEDVGDLVCDPLLHQVNVDLFNVDLLIELWWKPSRLEALLVNAHRHCDARNACSASCGDVEARVRLWKVSGVHGVGSCSLRLGGSAFALP